MPAKSKAQFRFMQAVAHGDIKKPGLTPIKAKEFVSANTGNSAYKALNDYVQKKKRRVL